MDYRLQEEEDAMVVQASVRHGLRRADPVEVEPRNYQPLSLSLRNSEHAIVGGLFGGTMWSWLMIDGLWIDDALRGQGLGRQLLLRSEAIAVARGCRGAWLGTFDFQARGFYERHGYTVFAALPDFPAGHTHYHLRKDLGSTSVAVT